MVTGEQQAQAAVVVESVDATEKSAREAYLEAEVARLRGLLNKAGIDACETATRHRREMAEEDAELAASQADNLRLRDLGEHTQLLAAELKHRVKNTLSIVQAIANQTFSGDPEARKTFADRISALAQAQDVLTHGTWRPTSNSAVVTGALAPHRSGGRIRESGPHILIDSRRVMALTLPLHELATTAKYGALSNAVGEVDIVWGVVHPAEGQWLKFQWTEQGGPPVARPARKGFGSRLIEVNLASEFGGGVTIDHHPAGVVCTISAPLHIQGEIGFEHPDR